ncbi:MAG: AAA family ATPase, partial [Pseudonocardiaceae bacterium]
MSDGIPTRPLGVAGEPTGNGESGVPPVSRRKRWPLPQGLHRARLLDRLRAPARLTLVLAPAGCGKTTLLAQYSSEAPGPIVWHRTERLDTDPAHFTARLAPELLGDGLLGDGSVRNGHQAAIAPGGFDRFLSVLREVGPATTTLVIDDAHLLIGSPTENCIEALLRHI